jgi:hypothetical protein
VGEGVTDDGLHTTVLNPVVVHPASDCTQFSTVVAPRPHVTAAVHGRFTLLLGRVADDTVPEPYPSSLHATDAVVASAGLNSSHTPPS